MTTIGLYIGCVRPGCCGFLSGKSIGYEILLIFVFMCSARSPSDALCCFFIFHEPR